MANSVISNLITTNITQNGGIDRITATEVRSVLNAINSFIQDDVVYGTTIPFDKMVSKMAPHTISGPITFTKNTTGAIAGAGTILELTADGTNKPDFSAFNETSASSGWVNTSGTVNVCIFLYTGSQYLLTIIQKKVLSQLSTPGSFTASTISSSEIDLSWTDVANEVSYKIYFNGINDFSSASVLTTLAAGTTSYHHTGLSASSTFYYWIVAVGDNVTYSDSNSATTTATTSSAGATTLNAPTGVALGTATTTTQPITWTDTNTSPNENSYKVQQSPAGAGTWTDSTMTGLSSTGATVTGLTASTSYDYRVVAVGDGTTTTNSAPSSTVTGSTAASSYDTDAQAAFDAIATAGETLTTTVKDAFNTFVVNQKSAGRWAAIHSMWGLGATKAGQQVNLKTPGTNNITIPSGWTASSLGMVFDNASLCNTGIAPSALSQNSTGLFFYVNTETSGYVMGSYESGKVFDVGGIGGTVYTNCNSSTNETTSNADNMIHKSHCLTRNAAGTYYYVKGSTVNTFSVTSVAPSTIPIGIGGLNGLGGTYSSGSLGICGLLSTGLSSADAQALNADITTLMTSMSRN